jgi:DNA replication protein DnaC
MERLNDIMGRTMPRRPSNSSQQPYPYQGRHPASQGSQTEPASQPPARRRLPERVPQSLPPNSPGRPDAPYSYSNGTPSPPNQHHYSNTLSNQRQSYVQEDRYDRFNGSENYTRPYQEQGESEAQTFTRDVYRHNRSTMYPSLDRRNEMNDGDMVHATVYNQDAQIPTQHHQNYLVPQSQQEQYFHRADVSHYIARPEADDLEQAEMEDDDELHMGYGDWEDGSDEIRVYRRSDLASRAQARRQAGVHEAVPAYIEQPTQSAQSFASNRPTRNLRDMRNEADRNKRSLSPYRTQQPMGQPRSTQSSQPYSSQHVALLPSAQPITSPPQGMPMPSARQGRQEQAQPPHLVTQEQVAPYSRRTTQPLNPQTLTDLNRQREYALQLNQARMRLVQSSQQVQAVPQPERKEAQTVARLQPVQPARQVSLSQPVQPQSTLYGPNKSPCTKCNGAGYLRANVPFGHPNFGKAIACECKEAERKEKRRQQLREMSNLDAFRQKTFSTFNTQIPGVKEAYQAALDFETEPTGWLVFSGPNGCGKTHLAAAIANQALDNGAVVLFEAAPDLLDHLRAAFAPTATEVYDQLFSKMREAELLILDDLGSQQSSPWANEKLFQLLNYRYNLSMATVITGNPKGIQSVDERIRSRLCDTGLVRTILMDRARDYRPQNPRRS